MIQVSFTYKVPDVEEITDAGFRRAHKEAGKEAFAWWIKNRMPDRFRGGAISKKLKWAKRDSYYQRRKRRAKPQNAGKDHVFRGDTRRQFRKELRKPDAIKATFRRDPNKPNVVRVRVRGLHEGYGRRKNKKGIDMRDEITRIAPDEARKMATLYRDEFVRFLGEDPRARSRRGRKKKKV